MTDFALSPLVRIDTVWREPWLISSLAQHGLGHYREGKPLQDALAVGGDGQQHTWLVVGDGVGSQPMSHHGSRLACRAVEQYLGERLGAGVKASPILMTEAFGAAHKALVAAAGATKQPPQAYATTLMAVLLSGDSIIAASIGDSAVVAYSVHHEGQGRTSRLTPFASSRQPPVRATYAITHDQWRAHMTVRDSQSPHIKGIVLATDGANSFFQKNGEDPASPLDYLYLDAIEHALGQLTPRRFCSFLSDYILQTEADHNDDRTVILAYRLDQTQWPPHARP